MNRENPRLVVHNTQLSLAGGAVRGWDRRNAYYYQIICGLAKHYGFDPEVPFAELPKQIQAIILYGSGEDEIEFEVTSFDLGEAVAQSLAIEGKAWVLPPSTLLAEPIA